MNCKTCQDVLPDLLFEPDAPGNDLTRKHLSQCAICAQEYASLQATFELLDSWKAPEISPYFDQKLAIKLREEQNAEPAGWFERLRDRFRFNTGAQFRPVLAGALALAAIMAGSGVGITTLRHPAPLRLSATVNDLQLLDRNAQALQQVDQILQQDASDSEETPAPPQS